MFPEYLSLFDSERGGYEILKQPSSLKPQASKLKLSYPQIYKKPEERIIEIVAEL